MGSCHRSGYWKGSCWFGFSPCGYSKLFLVYNILISAVTNTSPLREKGVRNKDEKKIFKSSAFRNSMKEKSEEAERCYHRPARIGPAQRDRMASGDRGNVSIFSIWFTVPQCAYPRLSSDRSFKQWKILVFFRVCVCSCEYVWWYIKLVTVVVARLLFVDKSRNDNETVMVVLVLPLSVMITVAIQIAKEYWMISKRKNICAPNS